MARDLGWGGLLNTNGPRSFAGKAAAGAEEAGVHHVMNEKMSGNAIRRKSMVHFLFLVLIGGL